jgi:L-asparaginase
VAGGDLVAAATGANPGRITAGVVVTELSRTLSFNHSLADALRIVDAIVNRPLDRVCGGIVVTHGTDTLQETAYLADLAIADDRTVVFTGAQRHAGEPDSDGPRNLADAILVAAAPQARGLGAVVVLAGRIHPARDAVKSHTRAPDGFDSPSPIGTALDGHVHVRTRPTRATGFALAELGTLDHRVDIVPVYLACDGVQVAACRAAGASGLVLQALGAGNPTPGVIAEVRRCVEAGLVVLVCSRCPHGSTAPLYGTGGGADLMNAGAVFAGDLPAPQARLLLAAALSAERDPQAAVARMLPHLGDGGPQRAPLAPS